MANIIVPTDEDLHKQWDEFSNKYEENLEPSTATIANVLIHAIGIGNKGEADHERVADVCCGTGRAAKLFSERRVNQNISLHGIDLVEKMVEKFNLRMEPFENISAQVGSAEKLPFPDDYFTGYFSNLGLQLVSNPVEMIKEAHRVLKPKGKAAFSIWGIPERSSFMTLFPKVLEKLNLVDRSKPVMRNNFHLGGNPEKLKELFMNAAPFDSFVTWSQPMVISPLTPEYCLGVITTIPANALSISKFDAETQEKVRDEIYSQAKEILGSSQPLCLEVEIIYVTKK